MSYFDWFVKHGDKHAVLVDRLHKKVPTKKEIIGYFRFENMVEKEPLFAFYTLTNKNAIR